MGARKRKPNRLADMNAAELERPWMPDLDPEGEDFSQPFIVKDAPDHVGAVRRMRFDRYGQLIEWAVILRYQEPATQRWRRIAVYDICHGKGMHVHLYDKRGNDFTQVSLRPVRSYREIGESLDEAVERIHSHWEANLRRSNRGQ